MKLNRALENLKKLHAQYAKEVKLLTEKKDCVLSALRESTDKMIQTGEAIDVLEGKSQLKNILQEAINKTKFESQYGIAEDTHCEESPNSPDNGNMPPAESGMKLIKVKNEVGEEEDVLVPISSPQPILGVTTILPSNVETELDDFQDPSTMLF